MVFLRNLIRDLGIWLKRVGALVGRLGWRVAKAFVPLWVLLAILFIVRAWFHPFFRFVRYPTRDEVDFVTVFLAALAIFYALNHEYRLSRQGHMLQEHLDELRRIEGSLSTRRLKRFPLHLRSVIELLKDGGKLKVLADCADYGSFFAAAEHQALYNEMRRFCDDGHEIRILVAGPPVPFTAASPWSQKEFFAKYKKITAKYWGNYLAVIQHDSGFVNWLADVVSQQADRFNLLRDWLSKNKAQQPPELLRALQKAQSLCSGAATLGTDKESVDAFFALLQARQYHFEKRLGDAGAHIKHVQRQSSLFLWILDKTDAPTQTGDAAAVFAFPTSDEDANEGALAFRTTDLDLIRTFEAIFEKSWAKDQSDPQQPHS